MSDNKETPTVQVESEHTKGDLASVQDAPGPARKPRKPTTKKRAARTKKVPLNIHATQEPFVNAAWARL